MILFIGIMLCVWIFFTVSLHCEQTIHAHADRQEAIEEGRIIVRDVATGRRILTEIRRARR